MPVPPNVRVGVWEDMVFVGAVVFGLGGGGACNGHRYGLARNFQMAELQRIALKSHAAQVSRIIRISVMLLKKQSPGVRLLVSYADPEQGHHGGVYQGAGWVYSGVSAPDWKVVWPDGRVAHSRIARGHVQFGVRKTVDISMGRKVPILGKHRYLLPLDDEMRARIAPLAKPYPKRGRSRENAAAGPPAEGGVIPTRPLH